MWTTTRLLCFLAFFLYLHAMITYGFHFCFYFVRVLMPWPSFSPLLYYVFSSITLSILTSHDSSLNITFLNLYSFRSFSSPTAMKRAGNKGSGVVVISSYCVTQPTIILKTTNKKHIWDHEFRYVVVLFV